MPQHDVTVVAPINIAFIKYWGKREGGEKLILPTNDSYSITLATEPFRSKTTAVLSDTLAEDELWLNGAKVDVAGTARLQNVLAAVRSAAPADRAGLKVRVVSNNNFPTAAGMASSASGYCALAAALTRVFESTVDTSVLARIGSGSACRSVYGGFVKWLKGEQADGSDCVARQGFPAEHWPEMNVLCAVVKGQRKDVSSTSGMQESVKTSPMMADRIGTVVPERMAAVHEAVAAKDFARFAEITMADSDDLQAVCRTTVPSIVYATDDSFALIRFVKAFNAAKGATVLGYTFDAGANCFMFALRPVLAEVIAALLEHFPTPDAQLCFNDAALLAEVKAVEVTDAFKGLVTDYEPKPLTYLLQSPVGCGPSVVGEPLIDLATLEPKL